MKLSDFTEGRDNNFNLIRMLAALAVLLTHSSALVAKKSYNIQLANYAVDAFFITSGFLVTASLLSRQSFVEFVWARVLRIYPALWAMLIFTVFGIGIFFTSLPVISYLANHETYFYLFKCATLLRGAAYTLPGVFENNPAGGINGSLWTLPHEIRLYAILAIAWGALWITKKHRISILKSGIITLAVITCVLVLVNRFSSPTQYLVTRMYFLFFSGAAYYILKERIRLSHPFFWFCVICLIFAKGQAFLNVYTLTSSYVLLYLAYIPAGFLRKYNQLGDYSYGVYIYAFLVQQSVVALIPKASVCLMNLISIPVTLCLAMLSWYFIERGALSLKGTFVGSTKKILDNFL